MHGETVKRDVLVFVLICIPRPSLTRDNKAGYETTLLSVRVWCVRVCARAQYNFTTTCRACRSGPLQSNRYS